MQHAIAHVLLDEPAIHRRLDQVSAQITEDYRGSPLTVVGVLTGAVMVLADLLRRIPLPLRLECIRVASYHGGTSSSGTVTFDQISLPDVRERDVLVVDDILDTGLTLGAIKRKLCEEGHPNSLRIFTLLRKKRSRLDPVEADYTGFDIEDQFVVGYGLDYQGRYRNLPFIGVLRQEYRSEPQHRSHS